MTIFTADSTRRLALVCALFAAGCIKPGEAASPAEASAAPAAQAPTQTPLFKLASEIGDGSEHDDSGAVASIINQVTVYSDRALVNRKATVPLSSEPTAYLFRNLPGWIDESSVRAASSAGTIVDVQVERRFLARSTDRGFRDLERKHQALIQEAQALDDELAILARSVSTSNRSSSFRWKNFQPTPLRATSRSTAMARSSSSSAAR